MCCEKVWGVGNRLVGSASAACVIALSSHKRTVRACEKVHNSSNFLRFAGSPHRDFGGHIADLFRGQLVENFGLHHSRCDTVDADTGGGDFFAEALVKPITAALVAE